MTCLTAALTFSDEVNSLSYHASCPDHGARECQEVKLVVIEQFQFQLKMAS